MYNLYSRYLRHIVLPDIGLYGHDILHKSKILCIGAGGLGSPALTYLSMIGIGMLGIIDFDCVDISNLNRQFIFNESNIGKKKVICVKKYIKKINSKINIIIYSDRLYYNNCYNIFINYDLILDCTDNLETKFLISDHAIKLNIPVIHGAVSGFGGYVSVLKKNVLCYRCIYNNFKTFDCLDFGIFGPIAGIIGIIQASESIKILLNNNIKKKYSTLEAKLFILNLKTLNFTLLNLNRNIKCKIC